MIPPAGATDGACRHYRPAGIHDEAASRDARMIIRPISPADRELGRNFVRGLSPRSRYFRYFSAINELPPQLLERFTSNDRPGELALVAVVAAETGERQIAVARYAPGSADDTAEFAVVVADAWQGRGLGRLLLRMLEDAARSACYRRIEGRVLRDNRHMLRLVRRLGFALHTDCDDPRLLRAIREIPAAGTPAPNGEGLCM